MRVPLSWLHEYVPIELPLDELAEKISIASAEVDFTCVFCGGSGCRTCKGTGWIEIGGSGMVDPEVFRYVGYDSERYSGFAFGCGIERVAQLKHGFADIRALWEGDLRVMRQF